ncbi:hypothetical protein GCM10023322_60480 [Rugosimonospora acidiphila]|uniref:Alanine-rich protein n=1 Tax=Rugosimonospora acidiphila TaxID=556531 RepID=A0ABP9SHR4_9ACTN
MQTAAYLYPWDVVGDPAAADLAAGLGVDHVVLAAVYHATRALTPRHPRHRVVVAPRTAAYYPVEPARWRGARLSPAPADWMDGADPFGAAVVALRAAGVPVHAWVVCGHVDPPAGSAESGESVVNAYGDRYPWALCPARDAVVEYALGLAEDVAALPGIDGVELEACGWYGFDHLSAHDKTGGVALSGATQYLMSLCFCDACHDAYRAGGIDPEALRERVRAALDAGFAGLVAASPADETAHIAELLGADLAAAVAEVRLAVADRLRAAMTGRIRQRRPELAVLLHASPRQHSTIAFTGVDPARSAGLADGLVVNCHAGPAAVPPSLAGGPVYASLQAVAGMGGRPDELPAQAEAARAAGASGVRLYHAGLAGAADLAAIRALTAVINERE